MFSDFALSTSSVFVYNVFVSFFAVSYRSRFPMGCGAYSYVQNWGTWPSRAADMALLTYSSRTYPSSRLDEQRLNEQGRRSSGLMSKGAKDTSAKLDGNRLVCNIFSTFFGCVVLVSRCLCFLYRNRSRKINVVFLFCFFFVFFVFFLYFWLCSSCFFY